MVGLRVALRRGLIVQGFGCRVWGLGSEGGGE